jgi:hypothetical protein
LTPPRQLVGSPVDIMAAAALEAPFHTYRHLSLLDKLALWASWAAAVGIFLTLGWMAMAPDDPYGAVSLLFRGRAMSMWLQAAGLSIVTSAIATILVSRSLPYAGPFAAALGLAVVSIRGQTAESLLIAARTSEMGVNALAMRMSLEALAWIGVLMLTFIISSGIARWCFPRTASPKENGSFPSVRVPAPAFAVAALVIALLAFNMLGAGMHSREIRHTQVCFVVAASVWLGCYFAYRVVPARGILWYVAAVVLMVLGCYWWAALQSAPPTLPVSLPPSNFLRVLPIQFVAVGVAAAISAYWSNLHHHGEQVFHEEVSVDEADSER